jgi:hypothetical protein
MARHVIVLEEGGCGPPSEWSVRKTFDPIELGEGLAPAWQMLCQEVVVWALTGAKVSLEIFICVVGDELTVPPDRSSLTRLLRLARDYSWAAKLFLVVSQRLRMEKLVLEGRESRERWMRTALEGKALDILQLDYDPKRPTSIKGEDLRSAADRAYARHESLAAQSAASGSWRCVVDPEQRPLQSFLSAWLEVPGPAGAPNLIIVVDDLRPAKQLVTVNRALRRYPGRRHLVVTLQPAPELPSFCQSLNLPAPVELRGPFELWYFLLRLNETRSRLRLGTRTELSQMNSFDPAFNGYVHPVELEETRVFHPNGNGDPPVIVITSAFNPQEPEQCFEAARDVGCFVERCPLGYQVLVEPAMTLGRLFRVMERWKDFNVWVHLGHGDGANGLEEAGTDRMLTPANILRCFEGRGLNLALAMFLTCRSTLIACLFAKAGAGVAIGFEEEVESSKGRELAGDVLETMLAEGTGQESILRGFRLGCHRIEVQEQLPSLPVAFYPRQP